MPEAGPPNNHPQSDTPARLAPRKRSMFDDPMVRTLGYLAFGLTVAFLITALSAVLTGVTDRSGPRSLAEREVAVAAAAIGEGNNDASVVGAYISALISSGQYSRAEREIASARNKQIDDSTTAEFTLAEARVLNARGKYQEAVRAGERAIKQIQDAYQARLKAGGEKARIAKNDGLPENYLEAVLVVAYANRDLKQWDKAIASFDTYITSNPSAADILIDRGNAKVEAGDKAGAEADFRTALKYIPDSEEALSGLSRIGVKR